MCLRAQKNKTTFTIMSVIALLPAYTIYSTLDLLSVYAGLLALMIFHYFNFCFIHSQRCMAK